MLLTYVAEARDQVLAGPGQTRCAFAAVGVEELIEYRARFLDIVTDECVVFSSELVLDGRRRSVSLVTVEVEPDGEGTQLTYTEQYALLAYSGDGSADVAEREGGTRLMLNRLGAAIADAGA